MTELERLKIVHEYIGQCDGRDNVHSAYLKIGEMIDEMELANKEVDWKARAERAEAALAEAQERAARFERLLKAEEARREGEPVLELHRVLKTAMDQIASRSGATATALYAILQLQLIDDGFDDPYEIRGYECK